MEVIELVYREPQQKFCVGDRVKCTHYAGVVIESGENPWTHRASCKIKWDDGHKSTWVFNDDLKRE